VIPGEREGHEEAASSESPEIEWGRGIPAGRLGPFGEVIVSNDSPFPQPKATDKLAVDLIQAHIRAAQKFFEACPVQTQLRLSVVPCVRSCEDIIVEGDATVLASPGLSTDRGAAAPSNIFSRCQQRLQDNATKRRKKLGRQTGTDSAPRRPLYVNNINSQRMHDCFRTLYGQDDLDVEHEDILPDSRGSTARLPAEVDVSQLFGIATSVDLQHLDLGPQHLSKMGAVSEMPALSHVNLNHNHLGDIGVELLFAALVGASCSVVHVSVSENNIGDAGAMALASCLGSLPRLTSLELCDNFIREKGSIALSEVIGGVAPTDDLASEELVPIGPLPMLSVDLRGNGCRELGAMRWAEVVCAHPTMQFLCLAQNELGRLSADSFLGLVYAAVASATLSVLDLRDNFPLGPQQPCSGPPPDVVIEELLMDLPDGEFDDAEVRQAVFIRRHRSGGGLAPEKKGRQTQQGHQGGAHVASARGGVSAGHVPLSAEARQ